MNAIFGRLSRIACTGLGFGMILAALSKPAWALGMPEIDPGSMAGALTLLTGGVLLLTGRKRRQS